VAPDRACARVSNQNFLYHNIHQYLMASHWWLVKQACRNWISISAPLLTFFFFGTGPPAAGRVVIGAENPLTCVMLIYVREEDVQWPLRSEFVRILCEGRSQGSERMSENLSASSSSVTIVFPCFNFCQVSSSSQHLAFNFKLGAKVAQVDRSGSRTKG
jgi:hypothetical protein